MNKEELNRILEQIEKDQQDILKMLEELIQKVNENK